MRIVLLLCVAALVACGDNQSGDACAPEPGELPTSGLYRDPNAIPIAAECVEGGLRDLPGRWFVVDPRQYFTFEYPLYEGGCNTGFRRAYLRDDDHDESDDNKFTFYTWTDGTRYYERSRQVFDLPDFGEYELVNAKVTCMTEDGTLAVTYVRFDSERGERTYSAGGTRFGPREPELAKNLELVGELGPVQGSTPIFALNLIVEGNYAYMVGLGGFDVVDISNPFAPLRVGHVDGVLNDVRIVRGGGSVVAFAASEGGDDRVWIIDVTDPAAPSFVSVIDEYAHSLQVRTVGQTTELYLANYSDEIPKYDVTNPLSPVRIGGALLPGTTISGVHDLTVYGDRIYANNTEAGLVAVDVSASFAMPTELARKMSAYSHASWAGVVSSRELVLHGDEGMAGTSDGGAFLRVLDGDPASPTFLDDIGRYQSRKEVGIHNFEVHGTKAYIAYYQDGVRIVDLADPTNPVEVAHYNTWNPDTAFGGAFEGAVGIRKVGDFIYVADDLRGLLIFSEL